MSHDRLGHGNEHHGLGFEETREILNLQPQAQSIGRRVSGQFGFAHLQGLDCFWFRVGTGEYQGCRVL